jgi:hypothetical protein
MNIQYKTISWWFTLEPGVNFNGHFILHSINGNKISKGLLLNSEQVGYWEFFIDDYNGNITHKSYYIK